MEDVRSNYPSDIGAIIFELSLNEESIVENPPPRVAIWLDFYTRIVRILRYILLSDLPFHYTA